MAEQARTRVSTDGVFLSTPGVFDGTADGLRHAFKMQFSPTASQRREDGGPSRTTVGTAFALDRVLLDFGAVHPPAVDFARAGRDCELIAEAIQKHPEVLTQALELVTGGHPDVERIRAASRSLQGIGLTETQALDNGGGIVALVLLAAAALLVAGCDACVTVVETSPTVQPQFPSSPGPMDAGADG
ncbi:hypothetical protein [Dactylosporangium sp. CA-092794]|uniref:hypothetical protein n=1 Tax=Dactylosporangium sp. CA-092794 TaxID=3239929 RepID=UPI003D920190